MFIFYIACQGLCNSSHRLWIRLQIPGWRVVSRRCTLSLYKGTDKINYRFAPKVASNFHLRTIHTGSIKVGGNLRPCTDINLIIYYRFWPWSHHIYETGNLQRIDNCNDNKYRATKIRAPPINLLNICRYPGLVNRIFILSPTNAQLAMDA
jgi:hypothetical protein